MPVRLGLALPKSYRMTKRVKLAPLEMIADRFGHEFLGVTDRLFEGEPFGKTGRDRCRICAAGAMGRDSVNEWR